MPASNNSARFNSDPLEHEQLQTQRLEEKAVLVACLLPESRYDERDPLGELRSLAETAGAVVMGEMIQNRRRPDPGTYLGSGKLDELKALRQELGASLVIFDNDLSPSQIRNIEKAVGGKIIDRSELILDIFAGRATTAAAKLQVELAQLEYTYPRLRAMWSHLGQVTAGAGVGIGTRGPGETQIEIDRRLVQRRKSILRARIAEELRRRQREVAERTRGHFTVCIVGYTNAGKSTLFNALTAPSGGGGAYADDRLFATLTTRTRRWPLGGGDEVLLSDTVGFVRDLPHHLVASFRATLEEAIHADVLLIVLDVSDPTAEFQHDVVIETLEGIFGERRRRRRSGGRAARQEAAERDGNIDPDEFDDDGTLDRDEDEDEDEDDASDRVWMDAAPPPPAPSARPLRERQLLVLNKVDRLADRSMLAIWRNRDPHAIAISAATGEGLDALREAVHAHYVGHVAEAEVTLPYSAAKALSFAESRGVVLDRHYDTEQVRLRVRLGEAHLDRLRAMGAAVERVG